MADDTKRTGLSATEVVLLVIGVLVVGWFLLGVFHVIVSVAWTLAKIALLVAIVVIGAKFLFGRSKSS